MNASSKKPRKGLEPEPMQPLLKERIRSELEAIRLENNHHVLHVDHVVDWAKSHPDSALHGQFEWDNKKAAAEFRKVQARHLIAIHVVNVEGKRTLVSLTIDRVRGGGYRNVDDVGKLPDLRAVMIKDAIEDLERVRTKYAHVKELEKVWIEIDAAAAARREARNAARRKPAKSA
jgi:hypothetical protein